MLSDKEGTVSLLHENLARKIGEVHWRNVIRECGFENVYDWDNKLPGCYGELPRITLQRFPVFTASRDTWGYNHVANICRFQDRFIVMWASSLRDECSSSDHIRWSSSSDGKSWSQDEGLGPLNPNDPWLRHPGGLYVSDDQLVAYCSTQNLDMGVSWIDAFVTKDGIKWTEQPKLAEKVARMNEGPRPTRGGRLIATGCRAVGSPVAFLFDGLEPLSPPRVVDIPVPSNGPRPCEPSWYQTEDGRIWMFSRDEGASVRLCLSWSDDEGETWSMTALTDFPDCMSRFHAGRLPDGRFYIVGNSNPQLMNRRRLTLSLSKDGHIFDEMFVLLDATTRRRIEGMHKESGYQYPQTLVHEDKMLIAYSINKEDMEVGILELSALSDKVLSQGA